ncbi:SpvB/TcaC N-terminal domain-containing protein [Shewanella sp. Pdp11]|uniref:SpvB/TcaC N-terminal domain-containing protein n=1 Tax=Shewanella sp. Pdp11 TaxID=2059264 RepID=UPI001E5FF68C|nr:SpvB/TcaC N-terminal domain-containing protein [Shewanella sp. Pdp11]
MTLPLLGSDWKNLSRVTVADAGGVDTVPAETADLNTATVKGQAGVSGGQASYHIPIYLPPGRNGVQPNVSLSYNSQGGNGLLGMGWSLNVGSEISRCGATFLQDGISRAVTFNAQTDKLCLDGQRLVAVVGAYGASNTEYRTEMDSFFRVIQHGAMNDSSSSFTVYKPDGSYALYGGNANSRFIPSGLAMVLSWKVMQESWSSGSNTINYQYETATPGEHLIKAIYYTGSSSELGARSVKFNYENRLDKRESYIQGGKVNSLHRLSSIEAAAEPSDWAVKYLLDYVNSQSSNLTLLKTIARCGKFNGVKQCSTANTFKWLDSKIVSPPSPLQFDGQQYFGNVSRLNEFEPIADIDVYWSTQTGHFYLRIFKLYR